jgi:hypothetical protein
MTRWMLAILMLTTPSFAASMNTYASQVGGANLVQLIPGELPILTTTFANTALQSTFPTDLVFQTNVAPVGTLTLAYTLTIGGQQFILPTTTYSCTQAAGCFFPADFQLPTFSHATRGTLLVNFNGSATEFAFLSEPRAGTESGPAEYGFDLDRLAKVSRDWRSWLDAH